MEALKNKDSLLTGPYSFFATGQPGYTLRIPLEEDRRGVIRGQAGGRLGVLSTVGGHRRLGGAQRLLRRQQGNPLENHQGAGPRPMTT